MKKDKAIFWSATIVIALLGGVMPALTSHTELAKQGIRQLGYPDYFGITLIVCKIVGVLALTIPQIPSRIKEWAYAGFVFNFVFATVSHLNVNGVNALSFFPLVILGILAVSYIYYHKLAIAKNI